MTVNVDPPLPPVVEIAGFRWAPWVVEVTGPGYRSTLRCWTRRGALREVELARATMRTTRLRLARSGRWGAQERVWAQQHTVRAFGPRGRVLVVEALCPEAWS